MNAAREMRRPKKRTLFFGLFEPQSLTRFHLRRSPRLRNQILPPLENQRCRNHLQRRRRTLLMDHQRFCLPLPRHLREQRTLHPRNLHPRKSRFRAHQWPRRGCRLHLGTCAFQAFALL
jgi:hypothetical protein